MPPESEQPADTKLISESLEVLEADVNMPTPRIAHGGATFESFEHRGFSLFWAGALVSNTGTWMQHYALSIVVYSFRRSELDLGIVNFASGVPVLILAILAGVVADRVDKRKLLMWSQAIMLLQAAALGWLYASGTLSSESPISSLVWVISLGLLGGIITALTFPSWQALLPDLVPRPLLLNAIALNSAQFQTSRLVGPLVASGLVLAGAGMGDIFYVNAASFLFVIAALAAMRAMPHKATHTHEHPEDTHQGPIATLTAGIRYAREHRAVGMLIVSTAIMTIFGMPYMMLLPAIADKSLNASALGVSYLMSANGLGAVVGSLVVASLAHRSRSRRLIPYSLLSMGMLLVIFGLSRSFVFSIVISTLAGAAVLTVNALVNTSIQSAVPDHLRGRVMALFIMAFMGLMPVSALIFGAVGEAIGPSNAVLGGAAVLIGWATLLVVRPCLIEETCEVTEA
ncbi:MAG: hypothetical protein CVT60_02170 [Actinobacteria bacterium HGW-Actinobacteria-10]|jgi:MFS family permease|nr:MAG: hypothetical protein CVT60_02170 [Actinobacteria bacterium HGW-Actinobacteria-10]